MFFFGDFIEPARDPDAAPWRWRWPPEGVAAVRFGARAASAAAGCVRYSFAPVAGPWTTVDAAPIAGAPPGHTLWQAEIPCPPGRDSCLYEIGYVDQAGGVVWSGRRRPLLFSDAPHTGFGPPESVVGRDGAGDIVGPAPAVAITPGPEDWRLRTHYALMLDRFAIGAPERRGLGLARHDPASPFAAHGGDLAGATDRLDYLADLGVGALLLSPLNLNGPEGYHGYHPLDLYAVDPRLGTMADVRRLVREAHARDIAVVLDMVVNHIAPAIEWRGGPDGWRGVFRYDLADPAFLPLSPDGLRDPGCFHDPSTDGDDVKGRLFGFLDDWKTERADVAGALIRSLKYWLAETDADGCRFDAVRHVDMAFWSRATTELRRYAAAIGKTGFRLIGEHSSHIPAVVDTARRDAGFDGMIDYPLYYPMRDAMGGDAGGFERLQERLAGKPPGGGDLVFIENHDSDRALGRLKARLDDAETARAASAAWLALVFLGPDAPTIAQGQEQEFDGRLVQWTTPDGQALTSDAYVREDLFPNPDCVWRFGPVNAPPHPPYDRSNATWRTIQTLARLRRAHPVLADGARRPLADPSGGVHAAVVGDGPGALLIAINLTGAPAVLTPQVKAGAAIYQRGVDLADGALRLAPYSAGVWAAS